MGVRAGPLGQIGMVKKQCAAAYMRSQSVRILGTRIDPSTSPVCTSIGLQVQYAHRMGIRSQIQSEFVVES